MPQKQTRQTTVENTRHKTVILAQSALNGFLLDAQARRLKPTSVKFYESQVTLFLAWLEEQGYTALSDITPERLRAYLIHLQDKGLADRTQHGFARAVRAWLNFCVSEGWLQSSPMKRVQMPKVDKSILPALSADQVRQLLDACESERDAAICLLLLDCGLRAAELIALDGGDLDIRTGVLTVRKGKGGKGRIIYFSAKTGKQLSRYYIQRGTPGDNEPVFLGESSLSKGRLTQSGLNQMLQRLGRRAGVAHSNPHAWRRTYALNCMRSGMSIYHLAQLMGHSNIDVLRAYLPLAQSDLQDAHQKHSPVQSIFR